MINTSNIPEPKEFLLYAAEFIYHFGDENIRKVVTYSIAYLLKVSYLNFMQIRNLAEFICDLYFSAVDSHGYRLAHFLPALNFCTKEEKILGLLFLAEAYEDCKPR